MHAIVSSFFDIGRDKWENRHQRSVDIYEKNAKLVLKTPEDMIMFIPEYMVDFVREHRPKDAVTHVVLTEFSDLDCQKYREDMVKIMSSESFRSGISDDSIPEYNVPEYNIIMWSKIFFVARAVDLFPSYTHFAWLDFGLHAFILPPEGEMFYPKGIADKIRIHCRTMPNISDLRNKKGFVNSLANRFAGGSITGGREYWKILKVLFEKEIGECLGAGIVHSDQGLLTFIYLKYPSIFTLSYGDWGDILKNYYSVSQNRRYVLDRLGWQAFDFSGLKIAVVLPTGSYNIGNEFIGAGVVNLTRTITGAKLYIFEAERQHSVLLDEEVDFVNSCDILVYGGGSIIGDVCYNNYVHTLEKVTIPKLMVGAGLSYYGGDNTEVAKKFLGMFDHIVTRDDTTYNTLAAQGGNVTKGIDMAFFAGDKLDLPEKKFSYTLSNVEQGGGGCVDGTYKIENTYITANKQWCGYKNFLSHGYWESLYSLYANASFVETSRVHTFLVCLVNGVKAKYNNSDSVSDDRHGLFRKIGLDLTKKTLVDEGEYVDIIREEKKKYVEMMRDLLANFVCKSGNVHS